MKIIALVAILLLTVPFVIAEEEKVYDEWVSYNEFFTVDDDYYEITVELVRGSEDYLLTALLEKNDQKYILSSRVLADTSGNLFISDEECKADEDFRYCLVNLTLDPDKGARADEYGIYRYGTRIRIYKDITPAAELTVTQEISQTSLALNEQSKVTLRITNTGNEQATALSINETVGDGLEIVKFEDFGYRVGNVLKASLPILREGEEVFYRYWVKAVDYVNDTQLKSSIDYNDPAPATNKEDETVKITWPYDITVKLSSGDIKILESTKLLFKLTNQETSPLKTFFSMKFPSTLIIDADEEFRTIGNTIYFDETLDAAQAVDLEVQIQGPYTGNYNLTGDLELLVNERSFKEHFNLPLEISHEKVTPTLHLSKSALRSDETLTITAYLENEDDNLPFFDIQGVITSEFFADTFTLDALTSGARSHNVLFKSYRAPQTQQSKKYIVWFNGTFKTGGSEEFSFSTQKEFTVLPKNQSLIHTHEIDKKELSRGEELAVTVSVENLADTGFTIVDGEDTFDPRLITSFGSTTGTANLLPGEELQLYVYKIKIPNDWTSEIFTITSKVFANGDVVSILEKNITVLDANDPIIKPATEENIDDQSSQENAEDQIDQTQKDTSSQTNNVVQENNNVEIEKPGFFKSFINAISSFFSNLLG